MSSIKMVVLTKSSKHKQYCVAGIDIKTNKWVRLVSSDKSTMYALTDGMMAYEDGNKCEVLDIIEVQVIRNAPLNIQTENVLINENSCFELIDKLDKNRIKEFCQSHEHIFGGNIGYVNADKAKSFGYSVGIYAVNNVELINKVNNKGELKKKISFTYNNTLCNEWAMTDSAFYKVPQGELSDKAYIVVSIPEDDYNGKHYKFVAQVFIE